MMNTQEQDNNSFKEWLDKMETDDKWKKECPVTIKQLRELDKIKFKGLKEIAKEYEKLEHRDILPGISNVTDCRIRIQLACKAFHGVMRDLDAMGKLLEEKQNDDFKLRTDLYECYCKFEEEIASLGQDMETLLPLDKDTKANIKKHKTILKEENCPIVVSGQVSSGKSSLLNLFLSAGSSKCFEKNLLPVSTLACTGRVCEMSYGTEPSAKILHKKGGDPKEFEINELEQHVNMQKESFSSGDEEVKKEKTRDIVRLHLPIPFLKGGITLIDTPGVGEDPEDSKIVEEYVQQHNVFGFIFTIHTSAGSGVNEKFQQMLRTMFTYEDENGNKKLDPESVIFVCNFWDQVKETDRKETKERVLKILRETGFLKNLDEDKQLFTMNSKGAFDTWNAGYIADDYDRLIGGMERFFDIGQKRKIIQSYLWIHTQLQSLLRSMKFLQFWARDMEKFTNDISKDLQRVLTDIEKLHHDSIEKMKKSVSKQAEVIAKKLLPFLQKKENREMNFSKEDSSYLEKFKQTPDLQEYKMDELIDKQITACLTKWEVSNLHIHKTKKKFEDSVEEHAAELDLRLNEFERRSLCADKSKDIAGSPHKWQPVEAGELMRDIKKRDDGGSEDMEIAFSRTYGNTIMKGCAVKHRAALAGSNLITDFARIKPNNIRMSVLRPVREVLGKYYQWKDFVGYMEFRAKTLYDEMSDESILKTIILSHMQPVEDLICNIDLALKGRIDQNKKLIDLVNSELIQALGSSKKRIEFFQKSNIVLGIFDSLLKLGYEKNLEDVLYNENNLQFNDRKKYRKKYPCGITGDLSQAKIVEYDISSYKPRFVSVKFTKGFLKESQYFFILQQIRKLEKEVTFQKFTPMVLGSYKPGYGIVLQHHMETAKEYFMIRKSECTDYKGLMNQFLNELVEALIYLHSHNLVHVEISLDSIFIKVGTGTPLLTNIMEKGSVLIPTDTENEETGNLLYLPPEVLQGPFQSGDMVDNWYTSAGDIFGLGVIMLELWHRGDIFVKRKKSKLSEWLERKDPGILLLKDSEEYNPKSVHEKWIDLARESTDKNSENRPSARQWNDKFQQF